MANLLELYAHDFSEFHHLEIEATGRFGYNRPFPFIGASLAVTLSRKSWVANLAGLVLVKQGSEVSGNPTVWDMAEFFVLRGYRRRGIGTQAAHEVWRQFPGPWEVRVMQSNVSAHHFWERAISKFTGEGIHPVFAEKGGKRWKLYSFNSRLVV